MFTIILTLIFIGLAGWLMSKPPAFIPGIIGRGVGALCAVFALALFLSLSYINVPADKIATSSRVYGGEDLPDGRIIALKGQKGPQADIYGPGFHIEPFVRFFYEIEYHDMQFVPEGQYGILVAKDGVSLRPGQFLADPWREGEFDDMLDATYFLENGGQKGAQLEVLKPGQYRINPLLWNIRMQPALDVPTGSVAVIRSNVQTAANCEPIAIEGVTGAAVSTPIVPVDCIGVWDEPLMPGRYYLNNTAYVSTIIPTRLVTWVYAGGYNKRGIDLTVDKDGNITQKDTNKAVSMPTGAADEAITVRAEGWEFPVEVRAVVQVHPKNAPIVVASIGNLENVENNIITPAIRDVLRTIGGMKGRKVMDFVEKRDEIVAEAEGIVAAEAQKAGVSLQELRLGEAAIPPELMVATLREQLAMQLKATYIEEKAAQKARIAVEEERAKADQQPMLVKAELERDAAEFAKERAKLEGEGERDRLVAIAAGQREQTEVLGAEQVARLRMFEMALNAAVANPDIVKVPMVNVSGTGGGGSLEGAAAILGASNLVNAAGNQPAQ